MPPSPEALRVVNLYRRQTAALRARVLRYIGATWGNLSAYRDADIDRFVAAVVPVVAGAQRQVASLTDAYLAAVESAVLGTRVAPIGVDTAEVSTSALRGVEAAEVYHRSGVTVWTALSDGDTLTAAAAKGLNRALDLASTDVQLAKTHATRSILTRKPNVSGYRRVLEGSKSCGLCIVATTQRYHRRELLPIHGGCDCGVMPIYGEKDPGHVIDPTTLDGLHETIAERFGGIDESARGRVGIPAYRDVLVVHNHGELGPVLSVKGQAFTGPSDL